MTDEAYSGSAINAGHGGGPAATRRDFLTLVAGAIGVLGAGAAAYTLIDSMNPAADVLAAGEPVEVDLSKVQPGQQIIVLWRGKPIFVVDRTPPLVQGLRDPKLIERLSDPQSEANQQPPYAKNWHRSILPQYSVLVGICTHLGCIPSFFPKPDPVNPVPDWLGGYFCPCHGSKYDLAGHVFKYVPAPYNLPVPPYHFPDKSTLRIGENPPDQKWDFNAIEQV